MDETEKNCLRRYSKRMTDDIIMTNDLLVEMYEKHIFECGMIELIKAEKTNTDQVHKMLELLPKRGPHAFEAFIHVIENSYPWLATLLESTVQESAEKRCYAPDCSDFTAVKQLSSEHDLDIKKDVSKFIHKHFGQSKRISERDKKAMEKFMTEHMNRVKSFLYNDVKEKEEIKVIEHYDAEVQVSYDCTSLIEMRSKIRAFLNKKERKSERFKTYTLESLTDCLETDVSELLQKLQELEKRFLVCHHMLAEEDSKKINKTLEALIQEVSSEMKSADKRLNQEKRTTDKLLNEIYNYSDEIHKLEQIKVAHRSQMKLLENQLEKLREENYKLKTECSKQEMINMQHAEKEKTIDNLRKLTRELRASKEQLTMDENNENVLRKLDGSKENVAARKSQLRLQNRPLNAISQNMRRNVTKTYGRRGNLRNLSYLRN